MNINYKQSQFELFPANSASLEDINKPRFLLASLTLSLESLVILAILGIMISLFAFSLGVERGKHLTAQALDERVSTAWNLAPRKIAQPVRQAGLPVSQAVAVTAAKPALILPNIKAVAVIPVKNGNGGIISKRIALVKKKAERFTIQASSYKNEIYAKDEALKLKAKGFNSFLIKKGNLWLVCLGQFATQANADLVLKKVHPGFRGSIVRRF